MRSLEQIRVMNADPQFAKLVKRYGWNAGKRVRDLEKALADVLGATIAAADALCCGASVFDRVEAADLRNVAEQLRTAHDAGMAVWLGEGS